MNIYTLVRKAIFENDDDYLNLEHFDSLEKAKKALKDSYDEDLCCAEGEEVEVSELNDDNYYIEINNLSPYVGSFRISCEIQTNRLR